VLGLVSALRGGPLISFDPNVRPGAVQDWPAYRAALGEALRLADLVKASERDLEAWGEAIQLDAGQALVLTRGAGGSQVLIGAISVTCPALQCHVVDTVGAGDAFTAGLLVALAERHALDRASLPGLGSGWLEALRFASAAAALTCERAGADPPLRAEVDRRLAEWPA
jgi:fructokinase